jgi:PRD1 phage membrane DNA delivery
MWGSGPISEILRDVTTIALAIVGVAVLAVLVSKQSNTTGVINSSSSAFNTGLATAEGPVTGYSPGSPIYSSSFGEISELGSGYNSIGDA